MALVTQFEKNAAIIVMPGQVWQAPPDVFLMVDGLFLTLEHSRKTNSWFILCDDGSITQLTEYNILSYTKLVYEKA